MAIMAAITNKDYDSLSVASSTSWWMLKENRHREKGPTTAVVALNEQQYNILIRIADQIIFLGRGFHWELCNKFPSWDVVTESFGQFFVLPMCFSWFGHLKLALLKEGVADAESIYLSIYNAVVSSRTYQRHRRDVDMHLRKIWAGSDPILSLDHLIHPLDFLVFKHLSDGNFEICVRKNLNVPGIRKVASIGKLSPGFNFEINDEISLARHLSVLDSNSSIAVSTPDNDPKLLKLHPSNAYLLETDHDDFDECEDKGFAIELEKCFASCYKELQSNGGSECDDTRLKELLYLKNKDNHQWILNPVITTIVGQSLEQFVETEGEQLLHTINL